MVELLALKVPELDAFQAVLLALAAELTELGCSELLELPFRRSPEGQRHSVLSCYEGMAESLQRLQSLDRVDLQNLPYEVDELANLAALSCSVFKIALIDVDVCRTLAALKIIKPFFLEFHQMVLLE